MIGIEFDRELLGERQGMKGAGGREHAVDEVVRDRVPVHISESPGAIRIQELALDGRIGCG